MDPPDLVNTSGIIDDASLLQCNTDMTTTPTTTVPSSSVFVGESNPNSNNANGLVPTLSSTQTTTVTDAAKVAASRLLVKPKKKKGQAHLSLSGTTSSNGGGGGSVGNHGENTGRWTAEEHRLFLQGLEQHGKGWKKIASLIKSRTVVQIRTHAQKYFQKLAKARQNGEDEGAVTFMEGRGGAASTTSASTVVPRRRRQVTGTKRKAIQSVVASAQRQAKKATTDTDTNAPIPDAISIAPALKYFVLPSSTTSTDTADNISDLGNVSGPALEDALFRFLTPCPPSDGPVAQVNPITLPSDNLNSATIADGEVSPTSVFELSIYPSWTDAKETPSWYAKGEDVDALLDVADTLDWLADTGDLNETYVPPTLEESTDNSLSVMEDDADDTVENQDSSYIVPSASMNALLPRVDSAMDTMVPTLSGFFHSQNETSYTNLLSHAGEGHISNGDFKSLPISLLDSHLQVFESPMEEHAFVSTILEEDS